jgi:hypothetical protein
MADHGEITRGHTRRPVRARQRYQSRGSTNQGNIRSGRRRCRHTDCAGPGGWQHASEEPVVSGGR